MYDDFLVSRVVAVTAGGRTTLNLFVSFTVVGQYWKVLYTSPKFFLLPVYLCFNNGVLLLALF